MLKKTMALKNIVLQGRIHLAVIIAVPLGRNLLLFQTNYHLTKLNAACDQLGVLRFGKRRYIVDQHGQLRALF